MKYIDSYNGVWEYNADGMFPWKLLAMSDVHLDNRHTVGVAYNNDEVRQYGRFKSLITGTTFDFPVEYKPGDHVYADACWIDNYVLDGATSYNPQKDAIVAEVSGPGEDKDSVVIRFSVELPKVNVKPYV
jgi:hypothetical protein